MKQGYFYPLGFTPLDDEKGECEKDGKGNGSETEWGRMAVAREGTTACGLHCFGGWLRGEIE